MEGLSSGCSYRGGVGVQEFIAIKDDVKICKRCAGQTVGGSVDAEKAKVKEFSEEERVRFGKD